MQMVTAHQHVRELLTKHSNLESRSACGQYGLYVYVMTHTHEVFTHLVWGLHSLQVAMKFSGLELL